MLLAVKKRRRHKHLLGNMKRLKNGYEILDMRNYKLVHALPFDEHQ